MRNRIQIGTASFVFLFFILCMSVFCLLSLSDAKNALFFAGRHAESVEAYYQADGWGQEFLAAFWKGISQGTTPEEAADAAVRQIPANGTAYVTKDQTVVCDIPTESGQMLHIEVGQNGGLVLSYYVYHESGEIIDTRMPVFGGDTE